MSIIGPNGEKLGGAPSIDGDHAVAVPSFPTVEDQVVVRGERVYVTMSPRPLRVETKIHDPSIRANRSFVAVPGDAVPQPPVAKTLYMLEAPIHDRAPRPEFVVNLGDVDYRPTPQRPLLSPIPISVVGWYRYPVSAKPEPKYRVPEADIHGSLQEERVELEIPMLFYTPPITAKIHDPSQTVSL